MRTSRPLFADIANVTFASTAATNSLISPMSRSGLALPANYFVPGKILRLTVRGFFSTTGTPTLQLQFNLDSTAVFDTTALTMPSSVTNQKFELKGEIACQAQGSSGTLMAQGSFLLLPLVGSGLGNVQGVDVGGTSALSINTGTQHVFDLTETWGTSSASNTITRTHLLLEDLDIN
jgi:hypothetical protein